MSETVTRHRGGGRDENGALLPTEDVELTPIVVAPGGGSEYVERTRDGELTDFTVYFRPRTDISNSDELTVRGERFTVVVNDWFLGGRGVVEVLCTRGQG